MRMLSPHPEVLDFFDWMYGILTRVAENFSSRFFLRVMYTNLRNLQLKALFYLRQT